jgi:hypothetical protein
MRPTALKVCRYQAPESLEAQNRLNQQNDERCAGWEMKAPEAKFSFGVECECAPFHELTEGVFISVLSASFTGIFHPLSLKLRYAFQRLRYV